MVDPPQTAKAVAGGGCCLERCARAQGTGAATAERSGAPGPTTILGRGQPVTADAGQQQPEPLRAAIVGSAYRFAGAPRSGADIPVAGRRLGPTRGHESADVLYDLWRATRTTSPVLRVVR
jgi:hypothetical protein